MYIYIYIYIIGDRAEQREERAPHPRRHLQCQAVRDARAAPRGARTLVKLAKISPHRSIRVDFYSVNILKNMDYFKFVIFVLVKYRLYVKLSEMLVQRLEEHIHIHT